MKNAIIVLFIAVSAIIIPADLFGEIRLPLPEGIHYHRFASSVAGPEAVWINPAALGKNSNLYVQYMGEYFDGDFADSWGLVVTGDGVGISYRYLEDFLGAEYGEYIFGVGSSLGETFYWGGSYRYVKKGPENYNKRHFWNFGLIYSNSPQYTMGAVFSNLNRGKIEGEKSAVEQLYSVSYRSAGGMWIFSTEMTLSSGQSLSDAEYRYGLDVIFSERIRLFASIDDDKNYQIGFRINFGEYFAGGQGRADSENNHLGTAVYAGFEKTMPPHSLPR